MFERPSAVSGERGPDWSVPTPTIPGAVAPIGPPPDAEFGSEAPVRPVVLRRPDLLAGAALVLAGLAANVSLWLPWVRGADRTGSHTGIALLRRGLAAAVHSGVGGALAGGVWQPVAIVVGGGVLVVLGMLLFVPAHTHRLVGVLALGVALLVTVGVVTTVVAEGLAGTGPGLWCAAGVAGFGLLGALKAMLTLPLVTTVEPVPETG
jgi:hypothetical protein